MTKRILVVVAFCLAVAVPARGDLVHYTFSGENGLQGTFDLDGDTPFTITQGPLGTGGVLASPLNSIQGIFGPYTFAGKPLLDVFDGIPSLVSTDDHWIIRSDISGPPVNGKIPTVLNLFIFRPASLTTPISLTPPSHTNDVFHFSYAVCFTDCGTDFVTDGLQSLEMQVPEASTVMMLVMGLGVMLSLRRRLVRSH
jgi:hypothetical protein